MEALAFYCSTLADAIHVDRITVWPCKTQAQHLLPLFEWGAGRAQGRTIDASALPPLLKALEDQAVIAIDDVSEAPEQISPAGGAARSILACRLASVGQSPGILVLERIGRQHLWSAEEQTVAECIASLVSACFDTPRDQVSHPKADVAQRRSSYFDQHVVDQYWEMDTDFRLQKYHLGGAKTSRDLEPLIGLKLWEMPQVDPARGSWGELQGVVAERGDIDDCTFASVDSTGQRVFLELSAKPSYSDDGAFLGYCGIIRDITNRVMREQDLKSSEQKYLNAARLANVASWIWDEVEARISYCSPELANIYGISPEELMSRTVANKHVDAAQDDSNGLQYDKDLSWIHPDDRDRYRAVVEGASRNRTGYNIVTRIIRDDGDVRVLHEIGEPVFDITGKLIETTGVLLDVTEQENRKSELELKRAQLENLMDNIPGAIYRVKNDENWTPIYKSAGFNTFFDPKLRDDQDGERHTINFGSVISETDMKKMNEAVDKAIADGSDFSFEYAVKRSDGSEIWLSERGRPIVTEDGEIELEGVLIDVTEKHEAQTALAQAQKMEAIGKLTGGVAHDFNNLLAVILGNLELLQEELTSVDQLAFVRKSIAATRRGADLTQNMLSFARQARLEPTTLHLNAVIEDTQNWISRTLPENIEIHMALSSDLWEVSADRSSTESAFLNLILNARDAMPHGGKMTIETCNIERDQDFRDSSGELVRQGRYAVLSVTDTGCGIPKNEIGKIFEPFYTTKEAGRGSGLGLSMIQGFVKQTGGSVQVYSEPGIGTTFRIYFKTLETGDGSSTAQPARAEEALQNVGAKVLVAEDEPEVLEIIQKTLEGIGCIVTPANSGDDALEILQQDPDFDLLVTDIVMPGALMGTHLAKAARALRPELAVIFMSGYANEAQVHGNGLRPEDLRLSKPIPKNDLIAAVKHALKRGGQP
ncbi:PAS domain S-box protein [Phaeobacter sp. QD34_3]|uniref:PAS domain S-box protein n=1 Tax=unclassified Phaeobacter TaxID=2621772 RepID=UPI00237FD2C1|nr:MULTISPECIES: PAS domain S-box protein [unclassified Phaeobacter]MDE4134524.1 PAS domain S-box protein [Phaeobacter sp. QD34_3]MDE4138183.1 PAS domain S-box protein [Phaeobacter sp. QD34_24]